MLVWCTYWCGRIACGACAEAGFWPCLAQRPEKQGEAAGWTPRRLARPHDPTPRFTFLWVLRVHHSEDPRTGDLLLPLSPPGQVFPPKQIKKDPAESQKQAKKKRGKGCRQNRAGNFRLPKHLASFQFYYLSYTKNCKFYNAPPSLRVASTGHKYITSVK